MSPMNLDMSLNRRQEKQTKSVPDKARTQTDTQPTAKPRESFWDKCGLKKNSELGGKIASLSI